MRYLFLTVIITVLAACSAKPDVVKHTPALSEESNNKLYIVSHGSHTGFVIPTKEIEAQLPELRKKFSSSPYIEFGWGDEGFYQAKEGTTGLTLRAVFWPTPSVVHAVAITANVRAYFNNNEIEQLCLTNSELSSLVEFIVRSFDKENGQIIPLKKGIYGNGQFYQGAGNYYLMNTCNKWTAKGLKSIGMDIAPTFKLTASSIMSYLRNRENAIASCTISN